MSATTTPTPSTPSKPAAPTTHGAMSAPPPVPIGLRRVGVVAGMVLAPWCWAVANTAYMLAIRDGGSDIDGAGALALSAEEPTAMRVAILAVMFGGILVVPAVLGVFRLAPTSRLVTVGGSLMVAGYICYAGVAASGFTTLAMAEVVGPTAQLADVIDTAQADPWFVWAFIVFVLGNLVGTLLLVAGLLRTRAVPRWAALAIATWPVLHVIGLTAFHNEVPQVIGALAQAAGFAGCALALRRRDSLDLRRG
ncbi:MAG TPA: hypothetical protein VLA55_00280 [Ornithinibacter sp.]|nr:hypothetical protein [Ornithinibacter sp.]